MCDNSDSDNDYDDDDDDEYDINNRNNNKFSNSSILLTKSEEPYYKKIDIISMDAEKIYSDYKNYNLPNLIKRPTLKKLADLLVIHLKIFVENMFVFIRQAIKESLNNIDRRIPSIFRRIFEMWEKKSNDNTYDIVIFFKEISDKKNTKKFDLFLESVREYNTKHKENYNNDKERAKTLINMFSVDYYMQKGYYPEEKPERHFTHKQFLERDFVIHAAVLSLKIRLFSDYIPKFEKYIKDSTGPSINANINEITYIFDVNEIAYMNFIYEIPNIKQKFYIYNNTHHNEYNELVKNIYKLKIKDNNDNNDNKNDKNDNNDNKNDNNNKNDNKITKKLSDFDYNVIVKIISELDSHEPFLDFSLYKLTENWKGYSDGTTIENKFVEKTYNISKSTANLIDLILNFLKFQI